MATLTIDDLAAAGYNPREITDGAADGLRASVSRFGDIGGITFNRRTGRLVTGHQRVEQLRKLGAQMVDGALQLASGHRFAVRVVDWAEAEEKAANVEANNPHIGGSFTGELDALLAEVKGSVGEADFGELRLDTLVGSMPTVEDWSGALDGPEGDRDTDSPRQMTFIVSGAEESDIKAALELARATIGEKKAGVLLAEVANHYASKR